MKVVHIFNLLILVGMSRSTFGQLNDDVTCPDTPDDEIIFLPSTTNCSQYYVCDHGIPILMECPGDLYFDQSVSACNYPDVIVPPCTGKLCKGVLKHVSSLTLMISDACKHTILCLKFSPQIWRINPSLKYIIIMVIQCIAANCKTPWIRRDSVANCYLVGTSAMTYDKAQDVR